MVDKQHDLRDRLAGCVYGAIIGDIFRGINQETLVPVFGSEFSLDMQDCLRYMEGYADGMYPVVEFEGKAPVTLLPDILVFRKSMLSSALGEHTGRFYPQPYLAACQAVYDTVYMKQGRTMWVRLNGPQNGSESLRGLCDAWNVSVALARESYAFPDAIVLSQNQNCDGSVVGMLAGARFGLHSIPGKWLSAVPVNVKNLAGKFINFAMNADKSVSEL